MGNCTSSKRNPHHDDTLGSTSHLARHVHNIDMAAALSHDRSLFRSPEDARVRYMTILIENDQVGDITITDMIDECIQMARKWIYDLDYIKLVFDYILEEILRKKLGNPERARYANEFMRFAKHMYECGEFNSIESSKTVPYGVPLMDIVEKALAELYPNYQPDWM
jgi:hypothetical protein